MALVAAQGYAMSSVFVNHKVDRVANEKVDRPDHWG